MKFDGQKSFLDFFIPRLRSFPSTFEPDQEPWTERSPLLSRAMFEWDIPPHALFQKLARKSSKSQGKCRKVHQEPARASHTSAVSVWQYWIRGRRLAGLLVQLASTSIQTSSATARRCLRQKSRRRWPRHLNLCPKYNRRLLPSRRSECWRGARSAKLG